MRTVCAGAMVVATILAASAQSASSAADRAPAATSDSTPTSDSARSRWAWPVSPPHVSRGFEAPVDRYSPGHRGVDIVSATASEVRSPASATVRFVGRVVDRPVLTLDHGGGVLSSYEPIDSSVVAGETVERGQPLGALATGGHCAAACLHVGVRVDGEYVSPLLFFDRVPPSILLPLHL